MGEASTLIGSMKVETGPPPPVTILTVSGTGTAGNDDGVVNLQWTASTATDLDHYVVYRSEADGSNKTQIAGGTALWQATGTIDWGLTFGATYIYEVVAVDWVKPTGNATAVSKSITISAAPSVAPAPPTELRADLASTSVTLTWAASPSAGVAGYHVWMNDGATSTLIGDIASGGPPLTLSYDQGAGATRYYTVTAYGAASPDSGAASIAAGYPTGSVGTETWARVQTPSVVSYDISAKINSVPSQYTWLKNLELWYLGPAGMSTAVKVGATMVTTHQAPVFTVTSAAWNGQPSGTYQFRWLWEKANGNTSATTKNFTCSGASGPNTPAQAAIP